MKQNIKQMLPVALIICITVLMSLFLYQSVMEREKENCWALLKDSSNSVTKEMQITFADNINILHLAANTVSRDEADRIDAGMLKQYRSYTTF